MGDRRDYFHRTHLDRGIEPGMESPPRRPTEHLGRPARRPSKIPGISDIPEIPDEPTVLPE